MDLVAALLRFHYPVGFDVLEREVPAYGARGKSRDAQLRMFERDKDELRALGVPIESVENDDGVADRYLLRARDFYLPYLALVEGDQPAAPRRQKGYGYQALRSLAFLPDELNLVVHAGKRVQALGDPVLAAEARSALRKLAFDISVADGDDTELLAANVAEHEPEVLDVLDTAVRARKRVTFRYHSMGSDETSDREVEPFGLVFVSGAWYLVGRDTAAGALRQFRVRRMSNARANAARPQHPDFTVPPDFALSAYSESRHAWELGDADALDAVVAFTRVDGVVQAAMDLGQPVPGAPRKRRYRVRRVDAFARWLLSLAGHARPQGPREVVDAWRDVAARTAALYADARPAGKVAR
ncbi:MAG TPA: WYL domain-containing protein [Gemmatimonadaceae bacterium]|nr:WYL domain-containing protein [Gemmatimonadaceae bacterium]